MSSTVAKGRWLIATWSPRVGREITLEMIEAAPSYETRANLVRAFVRQDSARAALVVRQLMQEGAHG